MAIYGQEIVRYTWNVVDDDNCVQPTTLDWWINDTELDGTDNTTEIVDAENDATQDKIYHSVGDKHIHAEVDFDDGWEGIYQHETNLDVTTLVYEEPVMGFSWLPENPTVLEETTITQEHDDVRDESADKAYGRIDRVDVDYYNDGTYNEEDAEDDTEFKHTFNPKEDDGIDIRLHIEYWDGWETQTCEITKHLTQTNIPPVSDTSRVDNGVCIPNYLWTATSHDEDDAVEELTYKWWLYQKDQQDTEDEDDDTWEEIETGEEIEFTYPFQYEDDYKLVLRTTDDDGDWTEKVEEFTITFDTCGGSGTKGSGVIILQPNRFQMVAIPVAGVKVKEYFLDKIAEIVDADASTVIEFVKAYGSNDTNEKKFQVFVPDLTNPDSSTNFELIQADGDAKEITAFYVRTKEFEGTIEIPWDTADGS